MKNYKIPFDLQMNMLTYESNVYDPISKKYGPCIMQDNHRFTASLKVENYFKGRSAINFKMVDIVTNKHYWFSISEFFKIIPYMQNGVIVGTFTFIKKGANYSLSYV